MNVAEQVKGFGTSLSIQEAVILLRNLSRKDITDFERESLSVAIRALTEK